MAGASMKSIKLRIHSMQNTRQITKAMEMVAASKMNKAQEKALRTRPYYTTLHSTLSGIAAATRDFSSPTCKSGRKSGSAAWPSPAIPRHCGRLQQQCAAAGRRNPHR